jgi:hypothetical protein
MRVAPFSGVKSSSIHITLATIAYHGQGGGAKLWSACMNIGVPPGPAMLASMFDSSRSKPSMCSMRRRMSGSWAISSKICPC